MAGEITQKSKRGIALVLAMTAVVLISLTAVVVMTLAARRYHLATIHAEHAAATMASEGGMQYAWRRLANGVADTSALRRPDGTLYPPGNPLGPGTTFLAKVNGMGAAGLVISSNLAFTAAQQARYGIAPKAAPDHREDSLRMNIFAEDGVTVRRQRDVTVRIVDTGAGPNQYRISAFSDYAN